MADKYEEMFNKEWEKIKNEEHLPNIMLLGESGCGKSSLINRIFTNGEVEIAKVNDVKRGTEDFEPHYGKDYNMGVNLIDSRGYELSDGVSDTFESYYRAIEKKMEESRKADPFDKIHIIWYCVSVTGTTIQDYDIKTLNMLLNDDELKRRVCLVLTKTDKDKKDMSISQAIERDAKNDLKYSIPVFRVSTNPALPLDLDKLIEWSSEQLDDKDLREAFVRSQIISLKAKRNSAGVKIAFYSTAAGAIGATNNTPVPHAALLTPLQLIMTTHIINSYGLTGIKNIAKNVVGAALIPQLGKTLAEYLWKVLPGGQFINAAVASSFTAALGCAISQICFVSCEKIANGEDVDFEKVFSSENISEAVDMFKELIKSKEKNDYISSDKAAGNSKKAEDFAKKYIEEHPDTNNLTTS